MTIVRCQSGLSLTGPESAELIRIPGGTHEVEDAVLCELQERHVGRHAALGQADSQDMEYWICWSTVIVPLAGCAATDPSVGDDGDEACDLYRDHEGEHSFLLENNRAKYPSQEMLRIMQKATKNPA